MESDTYRTTDGKAQFSFNFIKLETTYEIDAVHIPREIKQEAISRYCENTDRDSYKIILEQPPHDGHTARLMAGDWAETVWQEFKPKHASSEE